MAFGEARVHCHPPPVAGPTYSSFSFQVVAGGMKCSSILNSIIERFEAQQLNLAPRPSYSLPLVPHLISSHCGSFLHRSSLHVRASKSASRAGMCSSEASYVSIRCGQPSGVYNECRILHRRFRVRIRDVVNGRDEASLKTHNELKLASSCRPQHYSTDSGSSHRTVISCTDKTILLKRGDSP